MKVTFWGVRGSIPAPGPQTNRYGGNTSCITVETKNNGLLILDAGTGIAVLGEHLMKGEFAKGKGRASIVLCHHHWDHIQGFPFFSPVYVPGNHFDLYGHGKAEQRLESVLEGQMNPKFSPVQSLKNLGASFRFHTLEPKIPVMMESVKVTGLPVPHGATTALALRIEEEIEKDSNSDSGSPCESGKSVVYVSDVGYPRQGIAPDIIEHYQDADLLIHDCTYSPEDHEKRRNRGFSSIYDAAEAASDANVKHLAMFHYDQDYGDEKVDSLRNQLREKLDSLGASKIELTPAFEGLTIDI